MSASAETETRIDEIADAIYRIATPVPPSVAPGGFSFSQYLESRIADPTVKTTLMTRAHEAMDGAIAQGNLATDRLDAYMAEKQAASAVVPL